MKKLLLLLTTLLMTVVFLSSCTNNEDKDIGVQLVCEITKPTSNEITIGKSSAVTFEFNPTSENDVTDKTVYVEVNGVMKDTLRSAPYIYMFEGEKFEYGTHTVRAKAAAYYNDGITTHTINSDWSVTKTILIKNAFLSAPLNDSQYIKGEVLTASVSVDTLVVDSVVFNFDNKSKTALQEPFSVDFSTNVEVVEDKSVFAKIYSNEGVLETESVNVIISEIEMNIINPVSGANLISNFSTPVDVSVISNNFYLEKIELFEDTVKVGELEGSAGSYSGVWYPSVSVSGPTELTVSALSIYGKRANVYRNVSIQVLDVDITSHENGGVINRLYPSTIRVNVQDDGALAQTISAEIGGFSLGSKDYIGNGEYTFITTDDIPLGEQAIVAKLQTINEEFITDTVNVSVVEESSTFGKIYGGTVNSDLKPMFIKQVESGTGYLTISYDSENAEMHIVKMDQFGTIQPGFPKIYDAGTGIARSIISTNYGGYLFTGYKEVGAKDTVSWDTWAMKMDEDGTQLWEYTYPFNSPEVHHDMALSVTQQQDNGLFLAGYAINNNTNSIYIRALDLYSNGNVALDLTYSVDGYPTADSLAFTCASPYQDGAIYGGYCVTNESGAKLGNKDYYVNMFEHAELSSGSKVYGGEGNDIITSVCTPAAVGISDTPAGERLWLLDFGESLPPYPPNPVWEVVLGQEGDYPNYVANTVDGGKIITGSRTLPNGKKAVLVIKVDETYIEEWTRVYEIPGYENSVGSTIIPTKDKGYAVFGWVGNENQRDNVILKLDKYGNTYFGK